VRSETDIKSARMGVSCGKHCVMAMLGSAP